jgi:tetratricopeptide (TPR) repeat protein
MKDPSITLTEQLAVYWQSPEDEVMRREILRLAEVTGRWEDVLRTEAELYALAPDSTRKLLIARRAAALAEEKLGDTVRAFRGYLAAFQLSPRDTDVVRQLERLAFQIENGQGLDQLISAYERSPGDDAVASLIRLSQLCRRDARDVPRALEALERAARLDATDGRIATALGAWELPPELQERACSLCAQLVETAQDTRSALRLRLRLAHLRETQGRSDQAEPEFQRALDLEPTCTEAMEWLEARYRSQERWSDLAAHLLRRLDQPRPRGRRELLRELATLYEQRLGKPADALEALDRLAAEEPRNADLHAERARLCIQLGQWANAVEALSEEARAGDRARSQAAQRRIAALYEHELQLPERAAETYRALVERDATDQESANALLRLLEALGHWKDLESLLRRLATRAEGHDRKVLLRLRAQVLDDKLADPSAAAGVLRELRALAPDDAGVLERLLDNLRRGGRCREIAGILQERIATAQKHGAPPSEIAELLCQLGSLQAGDLAERGASRRTFERALAVMPDHRTALAESARLALAEEDYASYARITEREAELTEDPAQGAALLIELARVLRDRAGNRARAGEILERAALRDPRNPTVLADLLDLALAEERWEDAQSLASSLLDLTSERLERARLLVLKARAARRQGAMEDAQGLADEALGIAPDYNDAVQERAELHLAAGRLAEAAEVLQAALDGPPEDPASAAALLLLLGECSGRMGDLDRGFRALLEADRLRPGHLATRLAMGENRYRARQWREASLHLGLIGHPDAPLLAEQVARGYVHAAVAELRLRRPDKAAALYEAALVMRPDCVPALRALAELANAAGDQQNAADYLEREGIATGDPALLERAGEAWLALSNRRAARRCFEEGAARGGSADLLAKLLELLRDEGDLEAAWMTCQRLVELDQSATARAARRRLAAEVALARGDQVAALAQWRSALIDDDRDERALLYCAEHEEPAVAHTLLEARLPRLPAPGDDDARKLRAALWCRLGLLRRDVEHRPRSAIAALEQAVRLDPARREQLVDLYGELGEQTGSALQHHRELLAEDVLRVPSLRALARNYVEAFEAIRARCIYQVMELLTELAPDERAWIDAHAQSMLEPDEAYRAVLDDADHERLAHPQARALAGVFAALYDGAPRLVGSRFASFGCAPQNRVSPMSNLQAAQVFGQVARMLGSRRAGLYLTAEGVCDGIALVSEPPTGIVIDARLAHGTEPGELRFLLGRALTLTRPEYILSETVDRTEFAQLFRAVLSAFHPRRSRQQVDSPLAAQLGKLVPVATARRLTELLGERTHAPWSSVGWRSAVRQTANRCGLLACGDIATAVRILTREHAPELADRPAPSELAALVGDQPAIGDLLRFAISDSYLDARARVLGDR